MEKSTVSDLGLLLDKVVIAYRRVSALKQRHVLLQAPLEAFLEMDACRNLEWRWGNY